MIALYLTLKLLSIKAKAFEKSTKEPMKSQAKVLFEYLRRNKNTEYGLKYNFSGIRSIQDYQRMVPLSDCLSMRPYLDKMAKGRENILTKDRVEFFGATSGTTNLPKYIPSTKYSDSKKTELTALWGYYILKDHPGIFNGKTLAMVSPEVEGYTESGIPYGGESGHGYKALPGIIKHLYALPYEVFEIEDYDARYYSILRISMEQNITTVMTLNPNSIILLCQKIIGWKEDIINDIALGTLNAGFHIRSDIRNAIRKRLRPNPRRANELRDILKEGEPLLPKYFWPGLETIECWKSGSMKLYLKELAVYFGDIAIRDIGYLSTEARGSIPVSDEGAGGVLAITTNFYEFIHKDDIGKPDMRCLLADQLEKGSDYFIVVTTPGGLYRYNIDDVIRVNGFFNGTPTIEFVQKGLSATSLAGEKLYEVHVNEALNRALERNKMFVKFFTAVAEYEKIPHYVFLTEFSGSPPSDVEKEAFFRSVESELRREDREYDYVRNAGLLGPPVLKVVKKGEFEKYRAKKITEGSNEGQFKVPELTADRNFADNFEIAEEMRL